MQPTFGWRILENEAMRHNEWIDDEDDWRTTCDASDFPRVAGAMLFAVVFCVIVLMLFAGCESPVLGPGEMHELPPGEHSIVVKRCKESAREGISPSTCRIMQVRNHDCQPVAYGSGVLVAKANGIGYVLTARHVVEDGLDVGFERGYDYVVMFPHSYGFAYVIYGDIGFPLDPNIDLALLKIDAPEDIQPRSIDFREPEVGERLWQSGFGNSRQGGPSEYWSSVLPRKEVSGNVTVEYTDTSLLLLNKHARHGDSGGPIIDSAGRIRGVTSGGDGIRRDKSGKAIGRDPKGYHVSLADQQWLRDLLPENSILVRAK